MSRIWKMLTLAISIIILDQITKWVIKDNMTLGESIPVIKGLFSITYIKNPGAAFGFGANASTLFKDVLFRYLPVGACIWLFYLLWDSRKKSLILSMAYSLIIGGAIGNLIDRFRYKYVVDFLDFYLGNSHFPAFNVADSAITVAAGLLIIDLYLTHQNENKQNLSE